MRRDGTSSGASSGNPRDTIAVETALSPYPLPDAGRGRRPKRGSEGQVFISAYGEGRDGGRAAGDSGDDTGDASGEGGVSARLPRYLRDADRGARGGWP